MANRRLCEKLARLVRCLRNNYTFAAWNRNRHKPAFSRAICSECSPFCAPTRRRWCSRSRCCWSTSLSNCHCRKSSAAPSHNCAGTSNGAPRWTCGPACSCLSPWFWFAPATGSSSARSAIASFNGPWATSAPPSTTPSSGSPSVTTTSPTRANSSPARPPTCCVSRISCSPACS